MVSAHATEKDAAAAASEPEEDDAEPELTREGLLGALAGKAKEAVGELVGNEDLARAGRVQQAEINADAEAVREADQDCARGEMFSLSPERRLGLVASSRPCACVGRERQNALPQ